MLSIYAVFAATEGKSPHSIAIVVSSVRYLEGFLASQGASTDAGLVTPLHNRGFILYLREKRCFEDHPLPGRSSGASPGTPSIHT